jgi:hypothetical protein
VERTWNTDGSGFDNRLTYLCAVSNPDDFVLTYLQLPLGLVQATYRSQRVVLIISHDMRSLR